MRNICANGPKHLKLLGGDTPSSLTHGDYTAVWAAEDCSSAGKNGYNNYYYPQTEKVTGFDSHYHYRGTPLMSGRKQGSAPTFGPSYSQQLPGVKPAIPLSLDALGTPAFKTVKLLGGRTVASDAWNRCWNYATAPGDVMGIGAGYWAHRDGYNVLYGDAHAQWYGDPQQRFIWMSNSYFTDSSLYDLEFMCGAASYLTVEGTADVDPRRNLGFLFWHLLDESTGIDVGAWQGP
jgi:hypothetical protein